MPDMFDEFATWLEKKRQARPPDKPIGTYDLLSIVKVVAIQLRPALTASEVALALVHAAAYMERYLQENEYMLKNISTELPVRLETAEERRYGQNALRDVEEGWVPDELPDWLFNLRED